MKKLILLLGLIFAPVVQAHFFAYQEWEKDGRTIHEFFDMHNTLNPKINPLEQRSALIDIVQQYNNALVVAEDTASFSIGADFTDISSHNKRAILEESQDFECTTPLTSLCAYCFDKGIDVYNIECRPCQSLKTMFTSNIDKKYIEEITSHNDGDILTNFYASLMQNAIESSVLQNDNEHINSYYNCFVLDARTLHALHTSKHKNTFFVAGAGHIVRVNNILRSLGWTLKQQILPHSLSTEENNNLAQLLTPPHTQSQAQLQNQLCEGLSNIIDLVQTTSIDLNAIKHAATPTPSTMLRQCLVLANNSFYNPVIGLINVQS